MGVLQRGLEEDAPGLSQAANVLHAILVASNPSAQQVRSPFCPGAVALIGPAVPYSGKCMSHSQSAWMSVSVSVAAPQTPPSWGPLLGGHRNGGFWFHGKHPHCHYSGHQPFSTADEPCQFVSKLSVLLCSPLLQISLLFLQAERAYLQEKYTLQIL